MVDQAKVSAAVSELKELKDLFEKIKSDSEQFFARSKKLSETGAHEAQDLIDAVKSNWETVLKNFSSGGLSTLFSAFGSKKASSVKKKIVSKVKAVTAKKTSAKKAGSKKTSGKKAKKKSSKK